MILRDMLPLLFLMLNHQNFFMIVAGEEKQLGDNLSLSQRITGSIKSDVSDTLFSVNQQQTEEGKLFHRGLLVDGLSTNPGDIVMAGEGQRLGYVPTNPPDIEMRECYDATEYISWMDSYNETNLYKEYFDCQCTGDIQSKFILTCSLDNYCFTNDNEDGEQCINVRNEYSFTASKATNEIYGFIDSLEWANYCTEYLSDNGPVSGPLCNVNGAVCSVTLYNGGHDLTTDEILEKCYSLLDCNEKLKELGYGSERTNELCPSTTLNGKKCNSPSTFDQSGGCSGSEGVGSEDIYSQFIGDCSNVESCATSSCKTRTRPSSPEYTLEDRLSFRLNPYLQCPGETSSENPYTKFLLRKPDGDEAPVIKKCNWLAKKEKFKSKKKICSSKKFQLYSEEDGLRPASLVCTDTCSSFCTKEVGKIKFIAGTKVGDGGENVVVLKTCKWLSKQSTDMIANTCAATIEFEDTIYGQASEVCTTSCGCP